MTTVHYRLEAHIANLVPSLDAPHLAEFTFDLLRIRFKGVTLSELIDATAFVDGSREVSVPIAEFLMKLQSGQYQVDPASLGDTYVAGCISTEGVANPNLPLPLHLLPQFYQDNVKAIYGEFRDALGLLVRTIRWRLNVEGRSDPVLARSFKWSFDRKRWYFAYDTFVSFGSGGSVPILRAHKKEILALVKQGHREPLGHDLWREAWELRYSSPRSSLVIATAAVETALKQSLSSIAPDTGWLWDQPQTPPPHKTLKDYLAFLKHSRGHARVRMASDDVNKYLQLAVEARNKLVHTGGIPDDIVHRRHRETLASPRALSQLLQVLRQVLYLLDYNAGHSWAGQFLWTAEDQDRGTNELQLIYKKRTK